MRFGILGPLAVADDEGCELPLGGPKQRSVLAILLLHAGEVVSSDRLIEELWGEQASEKAAKTLHVYVSNLRKVLGAGWLMTRSPGYVLSTEGAEFDVERFQALAAEGRQALRDGDARRAVASLQAALGLWRGAPLADLTYERFAQGEIKRLTDERVSALEDRINAELALGRHTMLVGELESLVCEHPLRERLRGQLMLALFRSGRQAEALDAYRQAREYLAEELGLEPGMELRALQSAILKQDPSLSVADVGVPTAAVRESDDVADVGVPTAAVRESDDVAEVGVPTAAVRESDDVAEVGVPTSAVGESEGDRVALSPRQQRKVVTVLFGELVRSTEQGEQLDPEVLGEMMTRHLGEIRAVIERHGGTVHELIGDSVMAVFGIPQVSEDDALRAVQAAIEITRCSAATPDPVVRVLWRIGVNTGLVLAGSDAELAKGEAVTVTARLQQAAAPGEILIGAETLRLVRDAVRVDPLESLEVEGHSVPLAASRVLDVDLRAHGLTRRLDTQLVGRRSELGWLRDAWLRSVREPGCQLVNLLGPAGIGKSRLVTELLASLGQDALILTGRCPSYGEGLTFWPLLEALASVPGAAARQVLNRFETGTAAIPEELFLDVRQLLESLARVRPVILCIDDLQWAQPTLLDLLEHLVDLSRDAPILVLCLARLELLDYRRGWAGGKLRTTSVLLEPLSVDECEMLAAQLDDGLAREARNRAIAASEGNPLFLEEFLALAREGGAAQLPPTIQALIAARIERLPTAERQVLDCGAIEGEVFHRSAVCELTGTAPSALDLRLASLVRKELIRGHPPTLPGDEAFRFRHLVMRDVVYQTLPKTLRAELHERFAGWLLEESLDELAERDEIAGWHLEQAVRYLGEVKREVKPELLQLAADQLFAAGRRARHRADAPAARNLLERALALAGEEDPRRGVIAAELAEQLIEVGEFDRADAILVAAEGDPVAGTLADLARLRWLMHAQTARAPEAIRARLPAILERLRRAGDDEGLARAHLVSASLHWLRGQADDTAAEARLAAEHAAAARHRSLQEQALKWYLAGLWLGTAPASTIAAAVDRLEQDQPGPFLSSELDIARAELERYGGGFKQSVDLLERAIGTFRALGRRDTMAATGMQVAKVELLAGDAAAAARALLAGDEVLAELGERGLRSTVQAWLAQAYEQLGNAEAANASITLAETLSADDDVINFVITHRVRARLALRNGRGTDAERWARSSVKHAYMTDSLDDQGQARLDLARILVSIGRTKEAGEEARAATDLFAAKGDEFGRRQAETLLDQVATLPTSAE